MIEKRRYVRVKPKENEPVEIQIMGTDFIDVLNARDISEGGVGIKVEHDFKGCHIGGILDIIITLPGKKPFKVKGKIIHKNIENSHLFGVEFIEISENAKYLIREYVNNRLSESTK